MDKPSNKWLSIILTSILCLTIIGIVVTATTYRSTQKHALKMGTDQLIKINDFAINILTLKIESYSLSLEDYASNIIFDDTPLKLSNTEQIENSLSNKSDAVTGLYLLDLQGNLLDGKSFKNQAFTHEDKLPAFIKNDRYFPQALKGQVKQSGDSYFEAGRAYLNLYRMIKNSQNQPVALLIFPLNLNHLYLSTLDPDDQFNGYTMIKNHDMKVVMHPSSEQVSWSIVEDRKKNTRILTTLIWNAWKKNN